MAGAVRQVSTARGIDPRGYTLVAYGGGGPLHAAMVAEEIGIRQALIPWSPGLASAFGLMIAETKIDAVESDLHPLSEGSLDASRVARLLDKAAVVAAANGLDVRACQITIGVDMRYLAQAFEITVWTDTTARDAAALRELFEAAHRQRYGYVRESLACEVVSYRLRLSRKTDDAIATPLQHEPDIASREIEIALNGRRRQAKLLPRAALSIGGRLAGPAVLTEPTSTTVVPSGWEAECLPTGDLMLRNV
jgi:N-methylhydantoinase A